MSRSVCSVDGCPDTIVGLGLCNRHYRRNRANGTPGTEVRRKAPNGSSLEERFRFAGHEVTASGCHQWIKSRNPRGYGHIYDGKRVRSAHRVAWELANGREIPAGMEIRHKCDNRGCVNPDHLEIGTHRQNMEDRSNRGRFRGEQAGTAKLTEADVREIRALPAGSVSVKELARRYGVSYSAMSCCVRGISWSHVTAA